MGNQEALNTYVILKFPGTEVPKQYMNWILSRWMRSYRHGNAYLKLASSDSYFAAYDYYIRFGLLNRPSSVVRLAVLNDDKDILLGFSVARGDVLDYVYVQKDFRRLGIARKLIPFEVKTFTHLTRIAMRLWSTKLPKAIFDPFH